MTRDPIWDFLRENAKEKFDSDRRRFLKEAHDKNDGGWTVHTQYHWSRMVKGYKLDYWPSRKKWQYRGKIRRGDIYAFLRSKE